MTPKSPDTTALYAGTFNPFTIGHLDIVERALNIFSKVVIVCGVNKNKKGSGNVEAIAQLFENEPRVEVMEWSGLTIDCARQIGADILVRGARTAADFEAERTLADINRELSGIDTIIFTTKPQLSLVSSSMVRELEAFGHDTSKYIPEKNEKTK